MRMRVGFFLFFPPTLWTPGGGEIKVAKLKAAIERLDVDVTLFDPWSRRLDFDLFHIFGSNYELSSFVETIKNLKLPVIVSTIAYSSKPAWKWKGWKYIDRWIPVATIYRLRQRIYALADRLITGSRSEAYQLSQGFRIDTRKIRIIPNGLDIAHFKIADPELFVKHYGLQDFVLQVGRINRHKGQVRLIQALDGTGLNVIFIGPPDPSDPAGVAEFEALVHKYPWVHYLGTLNHDDPLLASAYAAARVHALPSLSESFGLVTLEAIAAGTAAVCGAYPPIQEYLGDMLYYCNVKSIGSIRETVLRAYEQGPRPGAQDYVLCNFSWDVVASKTVEIYKELVS